MDREPTTPDLRVPGGGSMTAEEIARAPAGAAGDVAVAPAAPDGADPQPPDPEAIRAATTRALAILDERDAQRRRTHEIRDETARVEIEALAALSEVNYAAEREDVADRLGLTVGELNRLVGAERRRHGDRAAPKPKQADLLVEIGTQADLYHAPDGTAYADMRIDAHRETWPIRSRGYRQWLARAYYERTQSAPRAEAMKAALGIVQARARFDGAERKVHLRAAEIGGRLYLDLCDDGWGAIEIDTQGWRIVAEPPVRFRRAPGMLSLPQPAGGASIDELRRLVNVRDADWPLLVGWLLAALRQRGPFPTLALTGEQGSAKSTVAAILRGLVDPNTAPLRSPPRDERDLVIAAANGHIVALDNVSHLPKWLSDGLCRIATGGGFATRELYSDREEVLFAATRPIVMTGIGGFVTRGDLADRSIVLTLDPIPEEKRRTEEDLWRAFDAARPGILAALLNAVAYGLRSLADTHLDRLPRMADFALWGAACEGALWPVGTFLAAYAGNRREADEGVIEGDLVASAIKDLLAERDEWSGTASDLLDKLTGRVSEAVARRKEWPSSALALSSRLTRLAPALRRSGIEITRAREGHRRDRIIALTRREAEKVGNGASALSASSAITDDTQHFKGLVDGPPADDPRTVVHDRGETVRTSDRKPGRPNALVRREKYRGADGADDVLHAFSGADEEEAVWTD